VARYEADAGLPIGEVLKRARSRAKIDIREVEERTKIRIKYLRAMEQDDWDVLPSHAYAKGFLRTYASLLGLDADALVDEYRRSYEAPSAEGPYTFTEPVLEGRRSLGGGRSLRMGPILVVAGIVVVAGLAVLGLTSGDDDGGKHEKHKHAKHAKQHHAKKEQKAQEPANQPDKVALRLEINSPVTVCLVTDKGDVLLDNEPLEAGATEGTYNATGFDLRFPSGYDTGQFDLFLDDEKKTLTDLSGPAAFEVNEAGDVKQVTFPGESCS
jgi:cytoskeleton protein RodZ